MFKARHRSVVPLTLPYLAALTPADWDVTLLDEQLEPIDFDYRADLVAITRWHAQLVPRLRYRRRVPPARRAGDPGRPAHLFPRRGGGRTLRRGRHWRRRGHLAADAGGRPRRAVEAGLPGRPAAQTWPACRCRVTTCWTCGVTARSGPLRSSHRGAALSAAISAPNGSCWATTTVAGRCRKSSRKSSIAARGTFSSATAISAASGATRWS